jgi:hypothetical protein
VKVRDWLGIDGVDLAIQAAVTFSLCGWVSVARGPDELYPFITVVSLVVLGVRRWAGMRRHRKQGMITGETERMQDLEDRLRDVEVFQDRVAELEERLDFTERLLTRQNEPGQLPR